MAVYPNIFWSSPFVGLKPETELWSSPYQTELSEGLTILVGEGGSRLLFFYTLKLNNRD